MCGWCIRVLNYWAQEFKDAVTHWISETWKRCSRSKCKWWCLCCNKWLCWIALILIAILFFIFWFIILCIIGLICVVCLILCAVICIIAMFGGADLDRCTRWCEGREANPGDISPIETPPIDTNIGGGLTSSNQIKKYEKKSAYVSNKVSFGKIITITNIEDLMSLINWKRFVGIPEKIVLDMKDLDKGNKLAWEKIFNDKLLACGCREGAFLGLLGLISFLAYSNISQNYQSHFAWTVYGSAISIFIISALFGKFLGLAMANINLWRQIKLFKAENYKTN